jgi:hypothetical protein
VQPHARFVIQRDAGSGHVTAVSAGQWHSWAIRSRDAKYSKFAYSTFFGPCLGTNHEWLEGCGLDNTLSIVASDQLPQDGLMWQNHGKSEGHKILADHLYSEWTTVPGVAVQTWLVPIDGAWHARVHRVTTDRVIQLAEGAFAAPDAIVEAQTDRGICLRGSDGGITGLLDLIDNRKPDFFGAEPNTSLYHSNVSIPYLAGRFIPGTWWIGALVLGAPPGSANSWDAPPKVRFVHENGATSVEAEDKTIPLD